MPPTGQRSVRVGSELAKPVRQPYRFGQSAPTARPSNEVCTDAVPSNRDNVNFKRFGALVVQSVHGRGVQRASTGLEVG
jgi:hypothetical protein